MTRKKQTLNLEKLTFASIEKLLGGAVGVQFDKEVRKAIMDCEDSPDLKNARKVALSVEFVPRLVSSPIGGRSEYGGCDVAFKISGVIPGKSIVVNMAKDDTGQGLLFNPDSPDDADQMTFTNDEG